MNGERIEKALARLREQPCEGKLERIRRMVLEEWVRREGRFGTTGTVTDSEGRRYIYSMNVFRMMDESYCGELSAVEAFLTNRSPEIDQMFNDKMTEEYGPIGLMIAGEVIGKMAMQRGECT